MSEKKKIPFSNFEETNDNPKKFVEGSIPVAQTEEAQQIVETVDTNEVFPLVKEETTAKFSEEAAEYPIEEAIEQVIEEIVEQPIEEAIEQAIEETVEQPNEESVEQVSEEAIENPEIIKIATNITEILSLVKVSNGKDEIIDHLYYELRQYKLGLQETFIAPLLKTIVREYRWVSKQYRFYFEKQQEEPQSELFNKLLLEFKVLSSSLLRLLNDYDIEPFSFKEGDENDLMLQNIVEIIDTEAPKQDGTVAECITCGFRNIKNNRLFCSADVKIYKLKNN